MGQCVIKKFSAEKEVESILEVAQECKLVVTELDLKICQADRFHTCLLAIDQESGQLIGFVIYENCRQEYRGLHLSQMDFYVHHIGIRESYRRRRQGTILIDEVKKDLYHSANKHKCCIKTDTHERNTGAHEFFRANRFKMKRVIRNFYHNGSAWRFVFEREPEAKKPMGPYVYSAKDLKLPKSRVVTGEPELAEKELALATP